MSRKGLSIFILLLLVIALGACRRGGDNPAISTPIADLPTTVPTAPPTSTGGDPTTTFATATSAAPAQTNTPTPSPSALPSTATAIPATATTAPPTATPVPPTAVPPTPLPNTGPPPGGSARIVFGPGATSATVQSTLVAGGDTDTWILRVLAGQVVTVQTISTAPGSINVRLGDMNGGVLASNLDTTGISAAVPTTGDYQINFSTASGAPQVGYTAQVFIPASGGTTTPTRIQFAPGTSVAQLNDSLPAGGGLRQYVVRMGAGQTLSVGVFASVPAVTNIAIRNSAGQTLTSGTDMSGVSATTAAAGDYFIDVSTTVTAPAINYLLTVNAPPVPSNNPQRIEFGPGQTSATVNGLLRAGLSARYVLRAAAGQILVLNLTGHPINTVDVAVTDANGAVLNTARDPLYGLVTDLPATGDYTITLSTPSSTDVTYVMDVIIPPPPSTQPTRIQFAAGATSATVNDSLAFGGDVDTWILRAAAGQVMNIGVSTNPSNWMNLFVYDAAGRLIANGDDSTGVAFPVPANGDYTILVSTIQAAPPVNYSMTVSLPPATPTEPVRISFGPGQTSATLDGQVVAGGQPREYVIRVLGNQTLLTNLNDNPQGNVDITITDEAGRTVNFGRAPTELGSRISATGDYYITLSTSSATPVNYSLTVIVPPLPDTTAATRIIFPTGSTTVTVSGNLAGGGAVATWTIGAQTGQTMHLFFGASQPGWLMAYVYNAAGDIIALGSDLDTVSAPVQATGDYHVVVVSDAAAGPISYSMVVEIP